ncbi:hypothetical protein EYF80_022414 [Liparis tanakae]|uniref:Uncharacterized protein n=1 Tax=Liparis tanakae TaxID=230148 RepID=A0A4Z2HNG5_9TELE|nr:hypothetical protein EYF80_022414 [Liparis tanakae]
MALEAAKLRIHGGSLLGAKVLDLRDRRTARYLVVCVQEVKLTVSRPRLKIDRLLERGCKRVLFLLSTSIPRRAPSRLVTLLAELLLAGGAMQDDKRHRRTERGRQGGGGEGGETARKRKRGKEIHTGNKEKEGYGMQQRSLIEIE